MTYLLSRGTVKVDQAFALREEFRAEITRKDVENTRLLHQIRAMDARIDVLEADLAKAHADIRDAELSYRAHKLDVYEALLEAGVDRHLLRTALTIE